MFVQYQSSTYKITDMHTMAMDDGVRGVILSSPLPGLSSSGPVAVKRSHQQQ